NRRSGPGHSTIDRELGRVDALVNNTWIGFDLGRIEESDPRDIRRTLEVNVLGVLLCSAAALRRMSRRHGGAGGTIVNVGAASRRTGSLGAFVHYTASKGAVDALTIGLGKGWRRACRVDGVLGSRVSRLLTKP